MVCDQWITLRCHQTGQAGKSTRNGGFSRQITKKSSVSSSKPCLITGGYCGKLNGNQWVSQICHETPLHFDQRWSTLMGSVNDGSCKMLVKLDRKMIETLYPLVMTHIANWKITIEIVDLPMKPGDFPVRYVSHYQRVCTLLICLKMMHIRLRLNMLEHGMEHGDKPSTTLV